MDEFTDDELPTSKLCHKVSWIARDKFKFFSPDVFYQNIKQFFDNNNTNEYMARFQDRTCYLYNLRNNVNYFYNKYDISMITIYEESISDKNCKFNNKFNI